MFSHPDRFYEDSDKVQIELTVRPGIFPIEIRNRTGQLMEAFQVVTESGNLKITVDMSSYPKGGYLLHQLSDANVNCIIFRH